MTGECDKSDGTPFKINAGAIEHFFGPGAQRCCDPWAVIIPVEREQTGFFDPEQGAMAICLLQPVNIDIN